MVRFENDDLLDVTVVVKSLSQEHWDGHVRIVGAISGDTYVDTTGQFGYRERVDFGTGCLFVSVDRGETTPGEYHN